MNDIDKTQQELARMAARINHIIATLGDAAPTELKQAAIALARADIALCDAAFDAMARRTP